MMGSRAIRLLIVASAVTLTATPLLAQTKVEGIVVTNKDGQLTIKTPHGNQTVSLPHDARVRSISGALGGQKEVVPTTSLIPGLPVTIQMDGHGRWRPLMRARGPRPQKLGIRRLNPLACAVANSFGVPLCGCDRIASVGVAVTTPKENVGRHAFNPVSIEL